VDEAREQVLLEGRRTADRLRTLGPARLTRVNAAGRSPSDLALEVGQRLADLAADSAGRERRAVPRLEPHAAGDQLALLASDVVAEGDSTALAAALAELTALRRAL
jgi:hypothetical protein